MLALGVQQVLFLHQGRYLFAGGFIYEWCICFAITYKTFDHYLIQLLMFWNKIAKNSNAFISVDRVGDGEL